MVLLHLLNFAAPSTHALWAAVELTKYLLLKSPMSMFVRMCNHTVRMYNYKGDNTLILYTFILLQGCSRYSTFFHINFRFSLEFHLLALCHQSIIFYLGSQHFSSCTESMFLMFSALLFVLVKLQTFGNFCNHFSLSFFFFLSHFGVLYHFLEFPQWKMNTPVSASFLKQRRLHVAQLSVSCWQLLFFVLLLYWWTGEISKIEYVYLLLSTGSWIEQ